MDKVTGLLFGLGLVCVIVLILYAVSTSYGYEFSLSNETCLINESPSEKWVFGSTLVFKVSITPARGGKLSPIYVTQEGENISVSMEEKQSGMFSSFDVRTTGRFSNMHIKWPGKVLGPAKPILAI